VAEVDAREQPTDQRIGPAQRAITELGALLGSGVLREEVGARQV